jgi:hypothetical protein
MPSSSKNRWMVLPFSARRARVSFWRMLAAIAGT